MAYVCVWGGGGGYQSKSLTATWKSIRRWPTPHFDRIQSSHLKCCCVVIVGGSSLWHCWIKKNANWEAGNVSLCQVTHKCLHEYIHRGRCRKLHCQMSECSKDLFLVRRVFCIRLSTFLYLIFFSRGGTQNANNIFVNNEWVDEWMKEQTREKAR